MLKISWDCYEVQVPISMSLSENVLAFFCYENVWELRKWESFGRKKNLNIYCPSSLWAAFSTKFIPEAKFKINDS